MRTASFSTIVVLQSNLVADHKSPTKLITGAMIMNATIIVNATGVIGVRVYPEVSGSIGGSGSF
ncbi:hypothetical protein E4U57_004496 [Claviceps arundinis]|uniref:Uncharacterized protein n=1 Tax=Claviceps arundinis TaxID=1623583 RepID=A0A9P7MMD2_9HYPO|nr:hypothetical protein E4U56_004788 [Claviceps arundinis]KAG5965078.1 hypothetical protein E4U57_004496 [Claviceps arundinis]